ncbi:hypothetical protein [Lysinibacillus sp. NPDC096259]|uniref:hypothetical protein n=1 Tax=Lysinibacillus sp. NPDC096259 TaxID=3390583 RepID=UPI003D00B41F
MDYILVHHHNRVDFRSELYAFLESSDEPLRPIDVGHKGVIIGRDVFSLHSSIANPKESSVSLHSIFRMPNDLTK